jgi:hypothetical protein
MVVELFVKKGSSRSRLLNQKGREKERDSIVIYYFPFHNHQYTLDSRRTNEKLLGKNFPAPYDNTILDK